MFCENGIRNGCQSTVDQAEAAAPEAVNYGVLGGRDRGARRR